MHIFFFFYIKKEEKEKEMEDNFLVASLLGVTGITMYYMMKEDTFEDESELETEKSEMPRPKIIEQIDITNLNIPIDEVKVTNSAIRKILNGAYTISKGIAKIAVFIGGTVVTLSISAIIADKISEIFKIQTRQGPPAKWNRIKKMKDFFSDSGHPQTTDDVMPKKKRFYPSSITPFNNRITYILKNKNNLIIPPNTPVSENLAGKEEKEKEQVSELMVEVESDMQEDIASRILEREQLEGQIGAENYNIILEAAKTAKVKLTDFIIDFNKTVESINKSYQEQKINRVLVVQPYIAMHGLSVGVTDVNTFIKQFFDDMNPMYFIGILNNQWRLELIFLVLRYLKNKFPASVQNEFYKLLEKEINESKIKRQTQQAANFKEQDKYMEQIIKATLYSQLFNKLLFESRNK